MRCGRPTTAFPAVVRRYYTPELANRSLPLVRRIAEDVAATAAAIREAWNRLRVGNLSVEEREDLLSRLKGLQGRYLDLGQELEQLGVELKDPFQGLLDFRARREGREVCLCWRLGEERVGHWHEVEAGFAGRRPIETF